jgi:hypothetical protein
MEGKSALLYKTLVVGVIVLFIGVGVQTVIANNLDNFNDVSKDDYCPINQEVYENSNCFIIGGADNTKKFYSFIHDENHDSGPFNKSISFGYTYAGYRSLSEGYIYTIGAQGKWDFYGDFVGGFETYGIWHIGVKGFRGFSLGGRFLMTPLFVGFFIGFAKEVKIIKL